VSVLKEGYPFIFPSYTAGLTLAAAAVFITLPPVVRIIFIITGVLLIIFAFFCVFFFRDPKIVVTQSEGAVLSPCNGTVMEVTEEGNEKVIRVFLSIFSVHLQRSPVSGTVVSVTHKNGKFLAAWDKRAHVENEQNVFVIKSADSIFTVRQIAGLVARRCVSWAGNGDVLEAGDKIGMIKFSSQVDLHMPGKTEITVKPGDKTKAGITIVARLSG